MAIYRLNTNNGHVGFALLMLITSWEKENININRMKLLSA